MRFNWIIALIASTAVACHSSGDSKQKLADSLTAQMDSIPEGQAPQPPSNAADSTKTVSLVFVGYDEGDFPHLLFREPNGTEYDFGFPGDNQLDGIPVVTKDTATAFGYRENTALKAKKFVADLGYRMVDTYNESGQAVKARGWRITSLRNDQ